MKPNNSFCPSDKTKITKEKLSTRNQSTSHSERIQNVSGDVFNSLIKMDETNLEFPKTKSKPMFLTVNRCSPLASNDDIIYLT